MTLEAIKWCDGKLEILDQLLLPFETKYIFIGNSRKGWEVINKMQVRGAPAIAIVGCLSLAAELKETHKTFQSVENLHLDLVDKVYYLISARPTAVNMSICGKKLINYSKSLLNLSINVEQHFKKIFQWCTNLLKEDISTNKCLSQFGCGHLLKSINMDKKLIVLTHCNTGSLATAGYGTALGVIREIYKNKRLDHVYCTETRPYNQGARLTAYELIYEKIPATLICDSMVGALFKNIICDAVLVGADRVARNGDTANKIGTYQIAVLAKRHSIPFYVCAPSTSIDLNLDNENSIPIEERPSHEITMIGSQQVAAKGIKCWNPSFDVTPAELITGIFTEYGVFQPQQICDKLTNSENIINTL